MKPYSLLLLATLIAGTATLIAGTATLIAGTATLIAGTATLIAGTAATNTKFKEIYNWKQLDFAFPDDESRQSAINSGDFIIENNMPLALDVWQNKLFVTIPRLKLGVPATLTYIDMTAPAGEASGEAVMSPRLIPYPDWETNRLPQNSDPSQTNLIDIFRVRVDVCDRLWVIDDGLVSRTVNIQNPQIVIYDLNTDSLIMKFSFPEELIKEDSYFANIIVDVEKEKCEDAFAYLTDLGSSAIIVYSFKDNAAWRVTHQFFHFDPLNGNYHVGGINFQWDDAIFGMTLSKLQEDGYKTAYFQVFSGIHEFSVNTKILKNSSIASDSYYDYHVLGCKGANTQSTSMELDENTGMLFYTMVNQDSVGCWDSNLGTVSPENQGVVSSDHVTMIYPSELRIDQNNMLWLLTNRMPIILYQELNTEEVNYRILSVSVTDAIRGTVCDAGIQ